ncbi:type II secretion system F family protein [Desulfatitalea alkaliphila]|uniref:Type II secretion system F family protein n=1 Tax=Desulfatitalea alkaliphila TaxID=2929485 RepID=A0AA41UR96_9BACT|nr:type II secretion system F family protein [Desulfatitalea alkaliphila]MCJ8502138.1 type II secretion system F family protein [Desulfatitalea alkaliphila]
MNYFRYKTITAEGKIASGIVQLPYQETLSAVNHLERDGSTTLFVTRLGRVASGLLRLAQLRPKRGLPTLVVAEILNNLALMLRAGLPLITALQEVSKGDDHPDLEKAFASMIEGVQGGATFSRVAERHPRIFPRSVVFLIRMGEETGRLDQMLKDASEHLQRTHQIRSDTKQALLYPAFVLAAISGGMLFWFAYVVPKIVGLFMELEVDLPTITLWLIAAAEFAQAHWWHMLVGLIGFVSAVLLAHKHNRRCRRLIDGLLLKLPIAHAIISSSNLAYISEYFAMLFNAGIDVLQSLGILEASVRNEVYREKMGSVRETVQRGDGIAAAFQQAGLFPPFMVRMISVGENSGTLSEQLVYIAEQYRRKLAVIVATIGKSIEPLVLVVAGTIFAVIIIGLFLPIYDLVSTVGAM